MSRSVIPSPFQKRVTLFDAIVVKVSADGISGPLVAMLAAKGINLATDVTDCASAVAQDVIFKAFAKTGQSIKQQEDALMAPIIVHTTGTFQYLKNLFTPNFKAVGDFGATISDTGKFTKPTTTITWMELFDAMKAKSDSYVSPLVSPLVLYCTQNAISLTTDATNGASALAKQAIRETAITNSEDARQKRDTKFKPILKNIRTIVSFLMKLYPNNTKELGYYGITVVLTPKVAKARTIKLLFGEIREKIKVPLNSIISITGTQAINLYKGKTATGTPIALAAGIKWIVTRGYGNVSIQNTSTTINTQLTILPKA